MAVLGEKIRTLRKKMGLTLDELAEKVGASKSSIWELENKERARPSADRITEIAKVLGVTSEYLLDDTANEPSASTSDEAFFRRYQALDKDTKQQLKEILKVLDKRSDR